ncbi:MAG: lipoprotein [Candidatus Berkiellales bacterium]
MKNFSLIQKPLLSALIVCFFYFIAGCGQTGPLYLPPPEPEKLTPHGSP